MRPTFREGTSWVSAVSRKNIFRKNLNWLKSTTGTKLIRLYLVLLTKLRCWFAGSTLPARLTVRLQVCTSLKKYCRSVAQQPGVGCGMLSGRSGYSIEVPLTLRFIYYIRRLPDMVAWLSDIKYV